MTPEQVGQASTIAPADLLDTAFRPVVAGGEPIPARIAERYAVEDFLGAGAFGSVYRAVDERLQKTVAVKLLGRHRAGSPETLDRFRLEALAASRLSHPNIVNVTDFDVLPDGRAFLVMEYVPGETLAAYLRRQAPMDPRRAVRVALALCDALTEAHDHHVVHRDLKPANILVGPPEASHAIVKIVDFGVARIASERSSPRITVSGNLVGTPAYMAPEQIRDDLGETDGRADIYAVGAVLHEMLTGQPPFEGKSMAALLQAQLHEAPSPPSAVRAWVSAALDAIVLRALDKQPARRFQTAGDMARALRSFLADDPAVAPRRRRSRTLIALALAGLLAAASAPLSFGDAPSQPATTAGPAAAPASPSRPAMPLVAPVDRAPEPVSVTAAPSAPAAREQAPATQKRRGRVRGGRVSAPDDPIDSMRQPR
jgi:serine/threonine protein kinase